jgi:hypothetical protein
VTVTVNALPVVSALAASPTAVCYGDASTLTATVTGGTTTAMTYTWYRGTTPLTTTSVNTYNLSALTATAAYSVTVSNSNGCTATSSPVTVTVNPLPVVSLAASSTTVCYGSAPILTASVTGGTTTATSYTWFRGTTQLGTTTVDTYNLSSLTATAAYSVTVRNSNGCTATSSPLTVTVIPTPVLSTAYSDVTVVTGTVLGPYSAGGTITGASWTNTNTAIGLGASGTMPIGAFTATNNGTSDISGAITVTPVYELNGVPCYGTPSTFTITVKPATGIVTITPPAPVCSGAAIAMPVPTYNLGGCTLVGSGTWTLNGSVVTPPLSPSVGTHTLRYDINTSCGTFSSKTVTVTVNALPVVSALAASPTAVCYGDA